MTFFSLLSPLLLSLATAIGATVDSKSVLLIKKNYSLIYFIHIVHSSYSLRPHPEKILMEETKRMWINGDFSWFVWCIFVCREGDRRGEEISNSLSSYFVFMRSVFLVDLVEHDLPLLTLRGGGHSTAIYTSQFNTEHRWLHEGIRIHLFIIL